MNNWRDASGRAKWRKKWFTVMVSPTFFSPDYYVETAVFQRGRKAASRRGRFSLSAGSLSAWGEKKRKTSGNEWEQRGGVQICLWFVLDLRANFLTDERRRCLSGLRPACHLSDNTHLSILLLFLSSLLWCLFHIIWNFLLATCQSQTFTRLLSFIFISNANQDKWRHIKGVAAN